MELVTESKAFFKSIIISPIKSLSFIFSQQEDAISRMANSVDDSGQKPYCIGDRIECFSMKDITRIEINFSNTLDNIERSDTGL